MTWEPAFRLEAFPDCSGQMEAWRVPLRGGAHHGFPANPSDAGARRDARPGVSRRWPVEDLTGYDRAREFGSGWTDSDRDGCNTRAEVLPAEAVTPPTVTGRCTLTGGTWHSWYDNQEVTATDIDHLVPLAEAWDSGAKAWTRERRVAYANYLDDPRHLEAVSQRPNRQKADQDIAEWLPEPSVHCRYLAYWVPVKRS
ncbi:hypothetical protein [Streptomyces sp. CA-251251]|uniref:hypothetical protein n=1 Tax=Streptomyces sp. CA-251251 TaxID=3240063 RepID=UPI003D902622